MHAPAQTDGINSVSAFAVFVKNIIRPRGLQRLGLPCLLNGSGVAYPWKVIESTPYPEHHLAEDYRFTTDLAMRGHLVMPCMEVRIRSMLPGGRAGFSAQRTRWEQGHMMLTLLEPARLLWAGLKYRSPRIWGLLFELMVPPVSLLVGLSVGAAIVLATVSALIGHWAPLICFIGLSMFGAVGLFTVWLVHGRQHLPVKIALQIPRYIFVKVPLYLRFITHRQRTWVGTEREQVSSSSDSRVTP
jgi:cellulose synthase/poly-beta-1,6-N-acetylglucosamine synthase-like glycosyltransferase